VGRPEVGGLEGRRLIDGLRRRLPRRQVGGLLVGPGGAGGRAGLRWGRRRGLHREGLLDQGGVDGGPVGGGAQRGDQGLGEGIGVAVEVDGQGPAHDIRDRGAMCLDMSVELFTKGRRELDGDLARGHGGTVLWYGILYSAFYCTVKIR